MSMIVEQVVMAGNHTQVRHGADHQVLQGLTEISHQEEIMKGVERFHQGENQDRKDILLNSGMKGLSAIVLLFYHHENVPI